MSRSSTRLRGPVSVAAALLVATAAFLFASSGPVGAGRQLTFTLDPTSAEVGDTVTLTSDVPCPSNDFAETGVTVLDADDNEVLTTTAQFDDDRNWTVALDTSSLGEGTFTVRAKCQRGDYFANYQSETLTLTAPEVDPTTTTSTTTTTTSTTVPTSNVPVTAAPAPDDSDAAPADAVAGAPDYTG